MVLQGRWRGLSCIVLLKSVWGCEGFLILGVLRGFKVDGCLRMCWMGPDRLSCFLEPIFEDTVEVILNCEVIGNPAFLVKVMCLTVKLHAHYILLQG